MHEATETIVALKYERLSLGYNDLTGDPVLYGSRKLPLDFLVMCGYASLRNGVFHWAPEFVTRFGDHPKTVFRELYQNLIAYERIYG